ncbi:EF-hand domain-containing protein [Xanthomonas sp. AmX2]|uniref:EF-hand domain-containing protein n=1 Tax=Xanthomonas sp. TaxID=29446 RepID=UPI0019813AEE|nr:EF-hand domain-containing protein [Xanthomonas sp.]MBN6151309.1 EF-hand domain-containing protein [Xanthomonas sp.]
MNIRNRKPLIGIVAALSAALALPAFAQDAQADAAAQAPTTQAGTQSATGASGQSATGASGQSATQSSASGGGGQTWADVDTDSDGAISKQEAQVNAGLTQIFAQADGDADGKLTPDEYKAFVAKQQGGGAAGADGQQQ